MTTLVLPGALASHGTQTSASAALVIDDAKLVRRAAEGDRSAFGELLRRHQGKVRGLLLRLCGDACLADDLAQEAFLRAYRGLGGFQGRSAFSTWMYRIAYNVYLSQSGRRKRSDAIEAGYGDRRALVDAQSGCRSELRRDLEAAIAALPERYRGVVVLYYGEGVNYPEIAEILEIPIGTVKTHLHRAKRVLREHLDGWEDAPLDVP